jgi:2-polyprenyl-3-methyl-5-hydroxy-6-metoxy-1,4-benzoquinol methylase
MHESRTYPESVAIPGAIRIESETAAVDYLSDLVAHAHGERSSSTVLEAGCGDRCALDYGPTAIVTGVDVASELLARNPRLDHRIVADLASADLDPASFDTVVCWDVLEHLGNAGSALDRLERALGETGTLILKVRYENPRVPSSL